MLLAIILISSFFWLVVIWWFRQRERAFVATVQQHKVTLRSSYLGDERELVIFAPAGYEKGAGRVYPVVYILDGQEHEALAVQRTLAHLWKYGHLKRLLVVMVPTGGDRFQEYGVADIPNGHGLAKLAAAHNQFLVEEVRPYVVREWGGAAEGAGLVGMSLSGLAAFVLGWQRPDLFSTVGVFSGSFWWRTGEGADGYPANERIGPLVVAKKGYQAGWRVWIQAATQDEWSDRDGDGVIDAIQDSLEVVGALEEVGYERGREVVYDEVLGGRHHYGTWAEVLPRFLRWGFSRL
ncbi:MAG TPA: alpha/beta hydrolase-fold protein [Anaerolineae bacterium]|nr:alpha/beta hydrolase-fold protein [Anaerolineae bacterium]